MSLLVEHQTWISCLDFSSGQSELYLSGHPEGGHWNGHHGYPASPDLAGGWHRVRHCRHCGVSDPDLVTSLSLCMIPTILFAAPPLPRWRLRTSCWCRPLQTVPWRRTPCPPFRPRPLGFCPLQPKSAWLKLAAEAAWWVGCLAIHMGSGLRI